MHDFKSYTPLLLSLRRALPPRPFPRLALSSGPDPMMDASEPDAGCEYEFLGASLQENALAWEINTGPRYFISCQRTFAKAPILIPSLYFLHTKWLEMYDLKKKSPARKDCRSVRQCTKMTLKGGCGGINNGPAVHSRVRRSFKVAENTSKAAPRFACRSDGVEDVQWQSFRLRCLVSLNDGGSSRRQSGTDQKGECILEDGLQQMQCNVQK